VSTDEAILSLRAYVERGRPTGGFIHAVLCNDLMAAVSRADESSLANLGDICRYVYNRMPAASWGSPEKVTAWVVRHCERREVAS